MKITKLWNSKIRTTDINLHNITFLFKIYIQHRCVDLRLIICHQYQIIATILQNIEKQQHKTQLRNINTFFPTGSGARIYEYRHKIEKPKDNNNKPAKILPHT